MKSNYYYKKMSIVLSFIMFIFTSFIFILVVNRLNILYSVENLNNLLKLQIENIEPHNLDIENYVADFSYLYDDDDINIEVVDLATGEIYDYYGLGNNYDYNIIFQYYSNHDYYVKISRNLYINEENIYIWDLWSDDYLLILSKDIKINMMNYKYIVIIYFLISFFILWLNIKLTNKSLSYSEKYFRDVILKMKEHIIDNKKYDFNKLFSNDMDISNKHIVSIIDATENIKKRNIDIENIISSMQEGLLLIDEDFRILFINNKGKHILRLNGDLNNKKLTNLYRNKKLKNFLEKIKIEKESKAIDLKNNDNVMRFFINKNSKGYVILIYDVTHIVKLEKMSNEFTSNITHELKTPITSIHGFAELVSMKIVTDYNQILDYNNKILSESKRLIDLVDDILKLAYIENYIENEHKIINFKDMFSYVFEILQNDIKEKNIRFGINGNAIFLASEDKIYELIFNLVSNAIKYNIENGTIYVDIFKNENNFGFKITDTGIGIPEKYNDRIFERFYRIDKSRTSKVSGTGLGLSIVKHIIEIYNGSITIVNENRGTTFIVVLDGSMIYNF